MAQLPKPKILPKVTYDPPTGDTGIDKKGSSYTGHTGPAIDDQFGQLTGSDFYGGGPSPQMSNWGPLASGYVQNPQWVAEHGVGGVERPSAPNNAPAGANPNEPGAMPNQYNQPAAPQGANAVPQSALTNNRTNYAAAQASGDTANMARLDAEWKRIAPLAQQYGISAQRLVQSYMQPSNPAAKSDFNSALAAAISDDVWAKEATNAFGRPPNQLEWDEHFKAMNFGGRDPLEGHPQAVQNIQAAMNNIGQGNQQQSYDQYSQWLAGQ